MPRPKTTKPTSEKRKKRKEKALKRKKEVTEFKYSAVLSDKEIRRAYRRGHIRIEPYNRRQVKPNSYDIRLGKWFYRQRDDTSILNMYDGGSKLWESFSQKAETLRAFIRKNYCISQQEIDDYEFIREVNRAQGIEELVVPLPKSNTNLEEMARTKFKNIDLDDLVFELMPGETVLGHTEEYIGGVEGVTTMIKTRSSLGRNNIGICKCAGWGDTGFTSRWTLEITNFSKHRSVLLVCGRRVGQIVFMATGPVSSTYSGKYQDSDKKEWEPSAMLPRLDLDED